MEVSNQADFFKPCSGNARIRAI